MRVREHFGGPGTFKSIGRALVVRVPSLAGDYLKDQDHPRTMEHSVWEAILRGVGEPSAEGCSLGIQECSGPSVVV